MTCASRSVRGVCQASAAGVAVVFGWAVEGVVAHSETILRGVTGEVQADRFLCNAVADSTRESRRYVWPVFVKGEVPVQLVSNRAQREPSGTTLADEGEHLLSLLFLGVRFQFSCRLTTANDRTEARYSLQESPSIGTAGHAL